jgi:thymidylate kinase
MGSSQAGKDIAAIIRDRKAIDEAFALAFADAVRRHRAGGVAMAMWKDGHVVLVDPFDVQLPGEGAGNGASNGNGGG